MTRLRIKLCGVRRARDAELCAQAGADEIGVVFAPHSRRCVTVAGAREIRAALPDDVRLVGVFQDAALSEALRVAEEVGLCAVQLHGVLPEPSGALPLYAALQVDGEAALARVAALRGFRRLLLDGPAGGGGGVAFGWTLAQNWSAPMLIFFGFGAGPSSFTAPLTEPTVDMSMGVAAGCPTGAFSAVSSFFPQLTRTRAKPDRHARLAQKRAFIA